MRATRVSTATQAGCLVGGLDTADTGGAVTTAPQPVSSQTLQAIPDTAPDAKRAARDRYRLSVIQPALWHPAKSPARGAAVRELASQVHRNPLTGKNERLSRATLYGWIDEFTKTGSLETKPRKVQRIRVLISRKWDSSCPLPPEKKQDIANRIQTYAAGLWRADVNGVNKCASYCTTMLLQECQKEGWSQATLDLCEVPITFVRRPETIVARVIGMKERNAKVFNDKHVPRVLRSRAGLMPGEIVCTDVHPIDIYVKRADGSLATPKMIGWLDLATNCMFCTIIFLDPGKGVTQTDVCISYADMIAEFGFGRHLQEDRGSENDYKGMRDGIEELNLINRRFSRNICQVISEICIDDEQEESEDIMRERHITKTIPYRPSSKPIERIFGVLEGYFRDITGYIGGDRMKKRTIAPGNVTEVYPSTPESLIEDLKHRINMYHHTAQRGHLAGRSPSQMRAHLQASAPTGAFRPAVIERHTLIYAMSEVRQAKVHNTGIEVGGAWYRHPEMFAAGVPGSWVTIRHAKWDTDWVWIKFYPDSDFVPVSRLVPGAYMDTEGAREQGRLQAGQNARLAVVAKSAPKLNMLEEGRRHSAALGPVAPVVKGATISLSPQIDHAARAAALPPPESPELAELPHLGPLETLNRKGEVKRIVPDRFAQAKAERAQQEAADLAAQAEKNRRALGINPGATRHPNQ